MQFEREYGDSESDSDAMSDSDDSSSEDDEVPSDDITEDPAEFDRDMQTAVEKLCPPGCKFSVPAENLRRSTRSRRELLNIQVMASQYENETDDDISESDDCMSDD